MATPKRGEIYWVDWSPARGSEQAGRHPSLVIQNDVGNELSPNVIVASVSTTPLKKYPFIVHIAPAESGLNEDSSVNLSAIITISKVRLGTRCGRLSKTKMSEVDRAICISLGIKIE